MWIINLMVPFSNDYKCCEFMAIVQATIIVLRLQGSNVWSNKFRNYNNRKNII